MGLLKEIKPEIKMAYGRSSGENAGYLRLFFVDTSEYNRYALENKKPIDLAIYLGGNFDWNPATKPNSEKFNWTKEDIEKYKDLPVLKVKVTGEN